MRYRPLIIFLVGLPLTGKTTFVKEYEQNLLDFEIISRDDLLLRETGKSDNQEAWQCASVDNLHGKIDSILMQKISNCVIYQKNILIDMTNLRLNARAEKLALIPENYFKLSLRFMLPDEATLLQRNEERQAKEGKFIPPDVLTRMKDSAQFPNSITGEFDVNWYATDLKEAIKSTPNVKISEFIYSCFQDSQIHNIYN